MNPDRLSALNAWERGRAVSELLRCCGSLRWAERMADQRPFASAMALLEAAERTWEGLGRGDWLEAFSRHPRIGQGAAPGPGPAGTAAWSAKEQAGMALASDEERAAMARANEAYERRFGHVFLICATGRSAGEMLTELGARMENEPGAELRIAAREQARITRLRLEKLLA